MREIKTHHDGHGLNEAIQIVANEPGPGGAAHRYFVWYNRATGEQKNYVHLFDVDFQCGPRNEAGSTAGVTDIALLAIVRDRLEAFQAGEYACAENDRALDAVRQAMVWMKERADNRAARGVLGTCKI